MAVRSDNAGLPPPDPEPRESVPESPRRAFGRRLPLARKLVYSLVALLLFLVLAEVGFRVAYGLAGTYKEGIRRYRTLALRGMGGRFAGHPYLVFTFDPQRAAVSARYFAGNVTSPEKQEETLRFAFLGGSTTASGNPSGYEGSYPRFVLEIVAAKTERPVEIMNCGTPAWTTAESLVNYCLNVVDYDPDVVVIHHGINDLRPRARSGFRPDYSHYRKVWDHRPSRWERLAIRFSDLYVWLSLKSGRAPLTLNHIAETDDREIDRVLAGTRPLAESTSGPFRRNLETLVLLARARGAVVFLTTMPSSADRSTTAPDSTLNLGLAEHNRIVRSLAGGLETRLIDLDRAMSGDESFFDLVHLTPEGNRRKAELVVEAVQEAGLLR